MDAILKKMGRVARLFAENEGVPSINKKRRTKDVLLDQ